MLPPHLSTGAKASSAEDLIRILRDDDPNIDDVIISISDGDATPTDDSHSESCDGSAEVCGVAEVRECVKLALALAENRWVQSLTLGECPERMIVSIAETLSRCVALQSFTLNLGKTSLGDAMGPLLAEALKQCGSLQSLNLYLEDTSLGDATGLALAEALKQCGSLQSFTLHLPLTSVGDATGLAFAEALKQCDSLQLFALFLPRTSVGDATGLALAEALDHSVSLLSFEIQAQGNEGHVFRDPSPQLMT